MKREPIWRRYLRFWGPAPDADIDDEFAFHIAAKVDELLAAGQSPQQARAEAMRRFGPLRPVWKECHLIRQQQDHQASRAEYLFGWWRDVHYSIRTLLKSKASAASAVVILALGIGGTTAVFTLLDSLIYKPLSVPHPEELVILRPMTGANEIRFRYPEYTFLRDSNQTLSSLAASGGYRMREHHGDEQIAKPAEAGAVSGNFFDTLGVSAIAGRTLKTEDDFPHTSHVAVASYRFARDRFGNPLDAVGKTIFFNDSAFTIVGVLPASFTGIWKASRLGELYVPLGAMAESYSLNLPQDRNRNTMVFGRRKSGVSIQAAQANLSAGMQQLFAVEPPTRFDPKTFRLLAKDGSAGYEGISDQRKLSLQILGTIVAVLLAMACINVGCILLARGAARQQEIAIRLSLGAGKARVLRQVLLESGLLALAGGIAGIAVAWGAERLILAGLRYSPAAPIDLSPDARVLVFGIAASLLTGLLCGLAPALQLLRGGRLAQNNQRPVGAFASGRVLVVAEIALSVVLIAGAVMFLRGFWNLRAVPLGFDARNMPVAQLELTDPSSKDAESIMLRAAETASARLRADFRITATAVGSFLPFGGGSLHVNLQGVAEGAPQRSSIVLRIDSDYFQALGISMAAGRTFAQSDDASASSVVILGETLARGLFPNSNPLGQQIVVLKRERLTVVGIARDIKYESVKDSAPAIFYVPLTQKPVAGGFSGVASLHLRTAMPPGDVENLVRQAILAEHLPLRVNEVLTLESEIGASYFNDTVRMQATAALGVIALLLIAAGIYGLMAYWVTQRTREIGVRMAVGSTSAGVLRLVLKQSILLMLTGLLIGVPGAILLAGYLSSLVFEAPPRDYAAIAGAAAILALIGLLAAAIPAARAAKLDPLQALRVE
ncbi:MAG: ABC transporter permease [Acidobacteriota bacterium]